MKSSPAALLVRSSTVAVCIALAIATVGNAEPISIDFDDGPVSGPVDGFYSGLGVTFSNAVFSSFGGLPGGTPPRTINSSSGTFFTFPNRIIATFDGPVDASSIDVLDLGGNGFQIDAYDAVSGGSLLDSVSAFGTGAGIGNFQNLAVTGPGIRRLEFYQLLSTFGDGVALDNFQFGAAPVTAPEPTSIAVWSFLGLAGCGYGLRRWRKRKQEQRFESEERLDGTEAIRV